METITMTHQEAERLKVIQQVIEKKLTWKEAAERLQIAKRQVARLVRRVKEKGNKGIIHGLRGKASNHQMGEQRKQAAVEIVRIRYADFGPTLANEKLAEVHGLKLSTSLLRQEMIKAGVWVPKRAPRKHRAWRVRKASFGELIQADGSIHPWFEDRGERCWLISLVDDATGRTYARFVDSEDTRNLMKVTRQYLEKFGRPLAFYVDKDSIYKTTRKASIEENLDEREAETQFTRAMRELGIQVICANSPQAKGRVERGFGTHQDRLVKELRLAGINDAVAGNRFLQQVYLPRHNKRFTVEPANPRDAHRPLLQSQDLDAILSLRTERILANDYTVCFQSQLYQVLDRQAVRVEPKNRITVEERLDGSVHLIYKGRYLSFEQIQERPVRQAEAKRRIIQRRTRPAATHPWKRSLQRHLRRQGRLAVTGRPMSQPALALK